MDSTINSLENNSPENEYQILQGAKSMSVPKNYEGDLTSSKLRVLFEAYPLTLKKGTGIYVYALNLLRGIDTEQGENMGLLLLLDEWVKLPRSGLNNSNDLKNIQKYSKLLSEIFQSRYPNIDRNSKKSNGMSRALMLLRKVFGNILLPISFFFRPKTFPIPSVLKSSLTEILNNSFISYDFLAKHQSYLINTSRNFLTLKILTGFANTIELRQLVDNYDIFHCTHLSPLMVKNIPRVTTIHDIIPLIRPELVSSQSVIAFAKLLKYNLKNSIKVIAVSQATKDDLVRYCQVPAEKVTVVYEAARPEFRPINTAVAKPVLRKIGLRPVFSRIGSNADKVSVPYFIFIGNIEPKKNVKRLLLAFQQFSMRDSHSCKLVMIGSEAWGFDDVKDLMAEMIAAGTLIHPGYLPTHELPALFSHAQALIMPSLIEGFGLPILEAMACGCPVITSNIPCIREITGAAAIKIDPLSIDDICQAITKVANDELLRANLSQLGLAQNKLFSWERCARETLAVYREAIGEYANK